MIVYPPNPTCSRHTKTASTMVHDGTLPPSGKLPARVVFRCTTDNTHTVVLPLLCTWEEYQRYKDTNQRGPLEAGSRFVHRLAQKFESIITYELVEIVRF